MGVVLAATGVALLMDRHFELGDLTMVYLLGVVVTAVAFGRGPAVLGALVSVAAFNFWFVPPRYTFEIADAKYAITFAVMFVVAIVTGTLTARLREQLDAARLRERRTETLHRLSQEFLAHQQASEILEVATARIGEVLAARVAVARVERPGRAEFVAGDPSLLERDADRAVVVHAFDTGEIGGAGRMSEPGATITLPLDAGLRRHGVMRARPTEGAWTPERFQQLRILAGQTSLALERARLAEETLSARAQVEREQTRSALLSSVSHDLRTPLAAITGAATGLRDGGATLPEHTRTELAGMIAEEAQRLNRLISNILDMTRLESGAIQPRRDWHSLEEVVGAALARLDAVLGDRPVEFDFAADLPLVPLDDVLFEQLVSNLVENADRYGPSGSPIAIRARLAGDVLELEVEDRGPGIPESDRERVFEKFHRGANSAGLPGAGLGLAIARGIAVAHGGTLTVAAGAAGGARFTARLPLGGAPPVVADEGPMTSMGPS